MDRPRSRLDDGDEASVHEIVDDRGRLAKVYRALSDETRDKLVHMVEVRIDFPPHAGVAWPRALLRDASGAVRGYTMDYFRGMYPLFRAYSALERQELADSPDVLRPRPGGVEHRARRLSPARARRRGG